MLDGPAREALREQGVLSTYQHFLNNGFIFDTTFCSLNSKLVKNRSSWPFPSISKVGWAYLTFPCLYQSAGNDSFLGVWKWKWNEILYVKVLCGAYTSPMKNESEKVAPLVKNLPAVQGTPVQFLGQGELLEKGKATHSHILGLPWQLSW